MTFEKPVPCRKCGVNFKPNEEAFGSALTGWEHPFSCPDPEPVVTTSGYNISILPDSNPNWYAWLIRVEYVGSGNWCARHVGSCLTKKGDWIWEPNNSSKTKTFLKRTRWDNAEDAIAAAKAAAPTLEVNGLTAYDVLAERWQR